jgi:hypothetical protein
MPGHESRRNQRPNSPVSSPGDRKTNAHPRGSAGVVVAPGPPVAWTQRHVDAPIFDSNAVTQEQHGKLNRQTSHTRW